MTPQGPSIRWTSASRLWAGHGPRELLDALHVDLEEFSGGIRRDDVAALALHRAPAATV